MNFVRYHTIRWQLFSQEFYCDSVTFAQCNFLIQRLGKYYSGKSSDTTNWNYKLVQDHISERIYWYHKKRYFFSFSINFTDVRCLVEELVEKLSITTVKVWKTLWLKSFPFILTSAFLKRIFVTTEKSSLHINRITLRFCRFVYWIHKPTNG